MYRAIIPGHILQGGISTSIPHHLTEKLLTQFSASSRCSSIFIDPAAGFSVDKFPKVKESNSDLSDGTKAFAICTEDDNLGTFVSDQVFSIAVLSPFFRSTKLNQALENWTASFPEARISVFKYGRILSSDADPSFLKGRKIPDMLADKSYPIMSQFLPARYRELEARHLAQAIRLNLETCEPEYRDPLQKVEYLDFTDCMKIIGLEDKI